MTMDTSAADARSVEGRAEVDAGLGSAVVPDTIAEPETVAAQRPRRSWPLGIIAFVVAALLAALEALAIYLASTGQPATATIIAQVLIVLTALPLALGVFAVIRRRDRDWGIAAIVVSIAANPLILFNILGFFGGR